MKRYCGIEVMRAAYVGLKQKHSPKTIKFFIQRTLGKVGRDLGVRSITFYENNSIVYYTFGDEGPRRMRRRRSPARYTLLKKYQVKE